MVCDIIRTELHTFKYEVFLLALFGSLRHCGTSVCVSKSCPVFWCYHRWTGAVGTSQRCSMRMSKRLQNYISIVGFGVLIWTGDVGHFHASEFWVHCPDGCVWTVVSALQWRGAPVLRQILNHFGPSDSLSNGRASCWVHTFPDCGASAVMKLVLEHLSGLTAGTQTNLWAKKYCCCCFSPSLLLPLMSIFI